MTITIAILDTSGSREPTRADYIKATHPAKRTLRISRLALMALTSLAFGATLAATTIFAPTVVVAVGSLLVGCAVIAYTAYRTHLAINNRFNQQCVQQVTQVYNSWNSVVAHDEVAEPLLPNVLVIINPDQQ